MATPAAASAVRAVGIPTIADLVALPSLADVRVVPRDAALDAEVHGMAPADPAGPKETGIVLVASEGIAGPVPDGVVAVLTRAAPADVPDVPFLVLGDTVPWAPVLAAVSELVAGGARVGADAARRALREPLLAGEGYGALAAIVSAMLGSPVAVLDGYLDRIGEAGLGADHGGALTAAVDAARAADPMSVLAPFMTSGVAGTVILPFDGPNGVVGAVVSWGVSGTDLRARAVLAELVDACAMEHAREEARLDTESRLRGELVEELVAGEVVSRDSIVRRARLLGADLSNGAVAMIGTLREEGGGDRSADELLARRFLSQVRAVLDLHWPRALVDWNAGRLLVLLPTPTDLEDEGPGVDERAHVLARRLLSATRETVPGLAVTLALSRHTAEPERLGAALDEAELALSIGERLGRLGEVVTFEETGTYKLLFQIFADRPEELSSFYESTLAALVAYDEQYQTELVGTLATYLELDGNLAATAGKLFTHRHTVRYRLDRIAELSGLDVGKSDDREKLSLGLKAMRLLGRTVRTGPPERPARGR